VHEHARLVALESWVGHTDPDVDNMMDMSDSTAVVHPVEVVANSGQTTACINSVGVPGDEMETVNGMFVCRAECGTAVDNGTVARFLVD